MLKAMQVENDFLGNAAVTYAVGPYSALSGRSGTIIIS
jgi:hypothetical protein